MDSTQTLHDFVLNLLTDSEARSAFQLDPEGALNEAGLGDITAADVQDVVPLVVDYASVQGDAGVATNSAGDLDLGALGSDPTSAIAQLQAVTNQLVGGQPTSIDGNVAAAGAIAVDSSGVGVSASNWTGVGVSAGNDGVAADLSATQDVAATLDSEVVDSVTAEATGTVDAAVGTADGVVAGAGVDGLLGGGPLDGVLGGAPLDGVLGSGDPVGGVLGTADSALTGVTSQVGDPDGLVGGVTDQAPVDVPDLDGVTGTLDGVTGTVDGATGAVGGVTGPVDDVLDGVGGLLDGGAGANGGAQAGAHGGTDNDLLGATDILF